MSYTLTSYADDHILLLTLNADFDIQAEIIKAFDDCFARLEAAPQHVVFISDARHLTLSSFNELLQGANMVRTDQVSRVNNHPKVLKAFTVTNSNVLNFAAKGLNSASFGFIELTAFASLEEALDVAHALIAKQGRTN